LKNTRWFTNAQPAWLRSSGSSRPGTKCCDGTLLSADVIRSTFFWASCRKIVQRSNDTTRRNASVMAAKSASSVRLRTTALLMARSDRARSAAIDNFRVSASICRVVRTRSSSTPARAANVRSSAVVISSGGNGLSSMTARCPATSPLPFRIGRPR